MIALATKTITSNPQILKFPSLTIHDGFHSSEQMTLRSYYKAHLLPELSDLAPRSLKADTYALNVWERFTENIPLSSGEVEFHSQLITLRESMLQAGLATSSINMVWRELRAMFAAAVDDGYCSSVPFIRERRRGRVVKSRLVKQVVKPQREIITEDELLKLWRATRFATYPSNGPFPASKLWKVALVLFWTFGARTIDFLQNLRWDHVKFNDRLLQFTAQKTSKLQGLPMSDVVVAHLKSIHLESTQSSTDPVFPGFRTAGHRKTSGKWKRGYYTTWRHEIQANSEIFEPIMLKHFRQRVVTRYNAMHPGLGSWIAGHYMSGVSAQNYDLPTDQIREVICSAPVPSFFHEIG